MHDALATLLRRHDPDRFLTALFAPADRRDRLLVLYAFNHELARAREVASETMLALIRLQWWREVVEGTPKRHEVATPLFDALAAGLLDPARLLPLIEAREAEAEENFETLPEWRDWLNAGAGGLAVAAAAALGASDPDRLRPFGAAYGVAGLLRSAAVLAGQGRCLLPRDVLKRHGLTAEAFMQDLRASSAQAALRDVHAEGEALLAEVSRTAIPRLAAAAALPAVLARRDLARWPKIDLPRRFGDKLAVTCGGLTGLGLPGRLG